MAADSDDAEEDDDENDYSEWPRLNRLCCTFLTRCPQWITTPITSLTSREMPTPPQIPMLVTSVSFSPPRAFIDAICRYLLLKGQTRRSHRARGRVRNRDCA